MRRILSSLVVAGGLVFMGITTASAHTFCSLDPTVGIGLPATYSLNLTVSTFVISADVYASGTRRTTTFGGGLGLG
jgi:hypothetical protein